MIRFDLPQGTPLCFANLQGKQVLVYAQGYYAIYTLRTPELILDGKQLVIPCGNILGQLRLEYHRSLKPKKVRIKQGKRFNSNSRRITTVFSGREVVIRFNCETTVIEQCHRLRDKDREW